MPAHHQHTNSSRQASDELVLVVHGVGDPKPGETLSLFARSVADTRHPLSEHQETLWLRDDSDSPRNVKTFATHVRQLNFEGNRSTLAEVFWGDLSRVNRGLAGVLSGLIQIVFGLRYVAFVGSHQDGIGPKGLQWLGLICSRLLHGPVLAVNFVLAILMLGVAGTETLWPGSAQTTYWASFMVGGAVLISLLASYLGWRLTRNSVSHRFWYWVMITAIFLSGLMLVGLATGLEFALVGYCGIMVNLLGAQWILLILALIVMAGFWLLAIFQPNVYRPALHVAFVLPAIAVGVWGLAIPLMWVTGSHSVLKALPSGGSDPGQQLARLQRNGARDRDNGTTKHQQNALPANRLATRDDRANRQQAREKRISQLQAQQTVRSQFETMFQKAAPLIGVQCIMFLFIAIVAVICLGRYMRWSESSRIPDYQSGSRAPRLIVNRGLQYSAMACAILGMSLALYVSLHEFLGKSHQEDPLCRLLVEANKYAIGILLPIGGVLLLSLHTMRPVLDIVLDVTNHFYFRQSRKLDRIRGVSEDFDIDEVTFDGGEFYFCRRDVIHRRIKRILEHYRESMPGNPTLTIVSHSQGSMIAIEVLNDDELAWVNRKFKQVNFITMGSPFHHIYQEYFQHFYPPLDDPQWENLRSRVSRWLNIFRIDDFVGTEIEFPASLPQSQSGAYSNHPVDRKGHMLYWSDRQVLKIIRQHDICRSLLPAARLNSVEEKRPEAA